MYPQNTGRYLQKSVGVTSNKVKDVPQKHGDIPLINIGRFTQKVRDVTPKKSRWYQQKS